MGYSFWLVPRVLLYATSHRQDSTYHSLCCTSHGALAGMRNSSMGPPRRIDPPIHRTMSECSYHGATSCSRKEGRNNAFKTLHLQLCGIRHDGGPLRKLEEKPVDTTFGAILFDWQHGIFYMHYPTDRIVHAMTSVTPVMEMEWETAHEGSIWHPTAPWVNTLKQRYISLPNIKSVSFIWAFPITIFYEYHMKGYGQ